MNKKEITVVAIANYCNEFFTKISKNLKLSDINKKLDKIIEIFLFTINRDIFLNK